MDITGFFVFTSIILIFPLYLTNHELSLYHRNMNLMNFLHSEYQLNHQAKRPYNKNVLGCQLSHQSTFFHSILKNQNYKQRREIL